jgi:hypothetical protein
MRHASIVGIDIDDTRFLDSVIERALELLPIPNQFDAKTKWALGALETAIGGKTIRQQYIPR